jgi:hypothetical protein
MDNFSLVTRMLDGDERAGKRHVRSTGANVLERTEAKISAVFFFGLRSTAPAART